MIKFEKKFFKFFKITYNLEQSSGQWWRLQKMARQLRSPAALWLASWGGNGWARAWRRPLGRADERRSDPAAMPWRGEVRTMRARPLAPQLGTLLPLQHRPCSAGGFSRNLPATTVFFSHAKSASYSAKQYFPLTRNQPASQPASQPNKAVTSGGHKSGLV